MCDRTTFIRACAWGLCSRTPSMKTGSGKYNRLLWWWCCCSRPYRVCGGPGGRHALQYREISRWFLQSCIYLVLIAIIGFKQAKFTVLVTVVVNAIIYLGEIVYSLVLLKVEAASMTEFEALWCISGCALARGSRTQGEESEKGFCRVLRMEWEWEQLGSGSLPPIRILGWTPD